MYFSFCISGDNCFQDLSKHQHKNEALYCAINYCLIEYQEVSDSNSKLYWVNLIHFMIFFNQIMEVIFQQQDNKWVVWLVELE